MTALEKLARANRWRIKTGKYASTDTDGFNGHFLVPLEGDIWLVELSDAAGWRRLSIGNAQRKVLPSWTVMCRIKDAFFGDEDWAVQFFPAKTHVLDSEWELHLWQPIDSVLPTPLAVLV
jgi:hypothetical protein